MRVSAKTYFSLSLASCWVPFAATGPARVCKRGFRTENSSVGNEAGGKVDQTAKRC